MNQEARSVGSAVLLSLTVSPAGLASWAGPSIRAAGLSDEELLSSFMFLEAFDPLTEIAHHLGNAAASEQDEHDDRENENLPDTDLSEHNCLCVIFGPHIGVAATDFHPPTTSCA